ncbi:alpha/beta hydrolase [bacterium]|nr:alpha/beta hydrolase [bacterium]
MRIPLPKHYYKIVDLKFESKRIRTYRFGIGPKKILSLPGFPHSGLTYLYFLLKYDLKKVQFITFDLPGWVGNSENIFEELGYNEEQLIILVELIINKYELNHFSVIGYSFGSSLAARLVGLNKYRIEKLALISPVLDGDQITYRRWLLNTLRQFKVYDYLKLHIYRKMNIYKAQLIKLGLDPSLLDEYQKMFKNSDSKVLLESIDKLFTSNYSSYLVNFDADKILIASSKDESPYIKEQSTLLRRKLKGEKTLYLEGNHEDFILHPETEMVVKVIDFLIK